MPGCEKLTPLRGGAPDSRVGMKKPVTGTIFEEKWCLSPVFRGRRLPAYAGKPQA